MGQPVNPSPGAVAPKMSAAVQRVTDFLAQAGHAHRPVMLAEAARTAEQAAQALGVALGQIAKSIVLQRVLDGRAVLVITSGDLRVDANKVSGHLEAELARADAAFVKAQTGFSIGGVAPVAHAQPCVLLLDRELFRFDTIWAAAGHPHAVFQVSPSALQAMTGAPVLDVTQPLAFSTDGV